MTDSKERETVRCPAPPIPEAECVSVVRALHATLKRMDRALSKKDA